MKSERSVNMSGFRFGEAACRPEGVPFEFQFSNCTAKLWIRALDLNVMAELAGDGVALDGKASDDMVESLLQNRLYSTAILRRLVANFEGIERTDGSAVEFSPENLDMLAGYFPVVKAVIDASKSLAEEIMGNSASSSAGSSTPSLVPAGEPTSATAEPQG